MNIHQMDRRVLLTHLRAVEERFPAPFPRVASAWNRRACSRRGCLRSSRGKARRPLPARPRESRGRAIRADRASSRHRSCQRAQGRLRRPGQGFGSPILMRSIVEFLIDGRDYARRATGYVTNCGQSAFAADPVRQDAVCFCLVVAGEACGQAARQMLILPPEIPWIAIKAMRNILVHEFWQIDLDTIYRIAQHDAVLLADDLDGLIRQLRSAEP